MLERTLDTLDFLKSQMISDIKNVDLQDSMSMRFRIAISKEMDRLIEAELNRPDSTPTPDPTPDPTPTPTPTVVSAPASTGLAIAYGTINLNADNSDKWVDRSGNVRNVGGLAELFVVDGFVYGRNAANSTYRSPGTNPGYVAITMTDYVTARSRAVTIIQCGNCPALPDSQDV